MSDPAGWILTVNLAATLLMTGAIWVVQQVHYPLFDAVSPAAFPEFERRHMGRITWVVAPLMIAELATAVAFWMLSPERFASAAFVGLVLLGVIWISTTALQAPLHTRLASGFSATAHRKLVATNWIRTAAWSARSLLMLWVAASWIG